MAIELRTFESGDTDYIAKLNANVAEIKAAIDALQLQAGGSGGVNEITVAAFWDALFNGADGLIGPSSYVPTQGSTTASVSGGGFYLAGTQTPVRKTTATTINFVGQTAGTKYIVISSAGVPTLSSTQLAGTAYSVQWSGSAFVGQPVRVAQCLFDASEATASRESTALGSLESPPEDVVYPTLDDRLEAAEEIAIAAKESVESITADLYESGLIGSGGRVQHIALGGSRSVGIMAAGATRAENWIDVELDGDLLDGFVVYARVEVRTDDPGTSVTPKVYNVTDASDAGVGVACSTVDDDYEGDPTQKQTFVLSILSGLNKYRLMLTPSNADVPVYGIGYLEILT